MADQSAVEASAPSAQENVSTDNESEATPAQAAAPNPEDLLRKHKFKLKVNDRDKEMDYDTMLKLAQKGLASDEVFRNASAKEKKMMALIERARNGDLDWVEEIAGDKALSWAEKRLLKKIELEEMDPVQRELMTERERREALEREREQERRQVEMTKREQERVKFASEIDEKISSAFKASNLKLTPTRLERVAQLLDASLAKEEGTLLDPALAIKRVMADIKSDAVEYISSLSAAELRQVLPKNVLDALRKADVEDARAQDPMRRPTQNAQEPSRRVSNGKRMRMSTDDFFNKLEQRIGR